MTQTPVNIFDFLLGDLNGIPGGIVTGQKTPGAEATELFSDLINSYLGTTGAETPPINIGNVLGEIDSPLNAKAAQLSESAAEFNRQLLSILPRQMGVIGANVKDALTNAPVELKPGKYEIIGSQIENGQVSLSLVSKDNPTQAITLTFPTEALSGLQGDRVQLAGDYYQSQYLDNLLSKLNLKEIEVKPAPMTETIEAGHEPVKITVIAEGSAGEILLRGKLERSRIRATAERSTAAMPQPRSEQSLRTAPRAQFDSDYLQNQLLAGNANGRTQIGARMLTGESDPFSKFMEFSDNKQSIETQQVYDKVFGYDIASVKDESAGERVSSQHVRFTLPDNINSALKTNGRSVTIRIEPEHLGPAKLSLSMNDDKLKARIVVESVPAKAALEHNLDRLVDQLAKADIKVDQIEISINGDSTHNQFLGRQPHWRNRVLPRAAAIDDDTSDQVNIPVLPSVAKNIGYAGPGGVNLLA